MNRNNPEPDPQPPPPTTAKTQLSPEAENIQTYLVERFSEVLEEQPLSPLDVMQGLIAFVSKSTDLLSHSGLVPHNFAEFLQGNLNFDFEFQKYRAQYGEAVIPLIKELGSRQFNGTLAQN